MSKQSQAAGQRAARARGQTGGRRRSRSAAPETIDAFRALDLTARCNAGPRNTDLGGGRWLWPFSGDDPHNTPLAGLPAGECWFWGVPFRLAPQTSARRFVVVGATGADTGAAGRGPAASVAIPVGARARRVLFAHACAPADGQWASLDGAGQTLGRYLLRYGDGRQAEQPLRRRWEIHDTNIPWGHHPFLCRNCRTFHAVSLYDTVLGYGRGQTGEYSGYARGDGSLAGPPNGMGHDLMGWWLFDLENPSPGKEIAEIALEASGPTPIALGAITLCDEDSDPFAWPPRASVAIAVEGSPQAPKVGMERGVIARQDSLFAPDSDFLTTDQTGWGQGGQTVRPGGYAEVHGSPRGTLTVRACDEEGAPAARFSWGDVLREGQASQGPVRVEVIGHQGTQWVHVRVVDEDTGRPVGCRIHFRSRQGAYLAPHGHQADVNTAWFEDLGGDCKTRGTPYAYIDGTCQVELPVGTNYAEVVRGFEYAPVRRQVEIKPGQRHLTLKVKRAFDMKRRGYYSGDTHVHFLSTQAGHLEAAAEDLNVVNLLASLWGRLFTSWEEFTGGVAPTSSPDHLIYVSQENRQHVLGHISLLGLKDLVAPMCTGGPQEDWIGGEIQVLMADWAEACKAQGGLVIMPHMPAPDFENHANIVMGHADAAEMCWIWQGEQIGQGERGYYRWLNAGQKLPIVGGTDKMSNGRILGGSRTYAKLAEGREFTYETWCQAVRAGNTFASTGAMIDLRVEGAEMGRQLDLPGNGGAVEVEVTAWSVWPLTAVELIVNGQRRERQTAAEGARALTLKARVEAHRSCWIAARCWGPHLTDAGPVMAHSSPVYVDVGRRCAFEPADGEYLLTHMEGGITWAEKIGVFRDEAVRARLIQLFREARAELARRAARRAP